MHPTGRFLAALLLCVSFVRGLLAEPENATDSKPRLFVLTDVSNEPDDEESLVRLLVYSNEYDPEGIVATTSAWLRQQPREDLIRRDIDAYAHDRAAVCEKIGRPVVAGFQNHMHGACGVGAGKMQHRFHSCRLLEGCAFERAALGINPPTVRTALRSGSSVPSALR